MQTQPESLQRDWRQNKMSESRRKKNILRELGYKHTLFGIPAAYCNWYLDNPSMHNAATDYLYNQMLISTGTAKVAGSLVSKASETFIKKRGGLESMMVP